MGNYVYPQIGYGWIEPDECEIDIETLEELSIKYDIDFRSFGGETNHGLKCRTIYGVLCDFNTESSNVSISNEEKKKIEKIYNLWKRKRNIVKDCMIKYHLVMCGDIDGYNSNYYSFDINE